MKTLLLSTFVALQAGDVLSTNRFLATGRGVEGNPVMGAFMQALGHYWWLPKLALCIAFIAVFTNAKASSTRLAMPMLTAMCMIYSYVVMHNLSL